MIGLFIMDVSSSTSYYNTDEISHYLTRLEQKIKDWTVDFNHAYINYRMGDELFFVSESPACTLVLAYYIKLLWPFKKQPVKFGIACGEAELPKGSYEHWNHPIIKQARLALDEIKSNDMTDFNMEAPVDTTLYNNILFYYMTDIIQQQTDVQREVVLSALTEPVQKELARKTGRSVSTVSTHLKKGHAKQLMLIEQALASFDNSFKEQLRSRIILSIGEMMTW